MPYIVAPTGIYPESTPMKRSMSTNNTRALVGDLTGGGYSALGKFTYFDSDHVLVPGADVTTSALPAVVNALKAETYSKIADAHSATSSYLPCFPPLIVPP